MHAPNFVFEPRACLGYLSKALRSGDHVILPPVIGTGNKIRHQNVVLSYSCTEN